MCPFCYCLIHIFLSTLQKAIFGVLKEMEVKSNTEARGVNRCSSESCKINCRSSKEGSMVSKTGKWIMHHETLTHHIIHRYLQPCPIQSVVSLCLSVSLTLSFSVFLSLCLTVSLFLSVSLSLCLLVFLPLSDSLSLFQHSRISQKLYSFFFRLILPHNASKHNKSLGGENCVTSSLLENSEQP